MIRGIKENHMLICESQEAHSEENQRLSSHAHSTAPHWSDKGGEGGGCLFFFLLINASLSCGQRDSLNDGRASYDVVWEDLTLQDYYIKQGNKTTRWKGKTDGKQWATVCSRCKHHPKLASALALAHPWPYTPTGSGILTERSTKGTTAVGEMQADQTHESLPGFVFPVENRFWWRFRDRTGIVASKDSYSMSGI